MNVTTLMPEPRQDAEETAMAQTRQQVRVAIREIREYAYRALIVVGASSGEATTAAEQVVHAELHAGAGLTGLAAALRTGAWPTAPLSLTRDDAGGVHLDCLGAACELRLSVALTDVVAGEAGEVDVTSQGAVALTAVWDAVLLSAAAASGSEVSAVMHGTRSPAGVRLATPEGDLVFGRLRLDGAGARAPWIEVRTGANARPCALDVHDRSTAHDRAARRRRAAQYGLVVDAATWTVVADHAQQFLVPEVDV